jgi:hypothetical protein
VGRVNGAKVQFGVNAQKAWSTTQIPPKPPIRLLTLFSSQNYPAWIRTMNERSKIFSVTITPRGTVFPTQLCLKAISHAKDA